MQIKVNITKLTEQLAGLSETDLNALLDARDADPFDSAWCEVNELVGGSERYPNAKDTFVRVSEATNQHEIASYIADDLDLMFRAARAEVETPFLAFLSDCYARGMVPTQWRNI